MQAPGAFSHSLRSHLPMALLAMVLAACSGGGSGTAPPSTAAARTAAPVGAGTSTPAGAATSAATQPPMAGGGATGKPVTKTADLINLLGPGDFEAVGIGGAGAPSNNPSGNGAYIVYRGNSGAGGGLELDVFWFDTAADATADFGDPGYYALDSADVAAIGADKGWISLSELGNDPGTTYAELRGLKGRIWFVLSIPSGDQAMAQLLALATIVISRAGSLT